MRHRKAQTKLNRSPSHRRATFSNLLLGLVEHGRVQTTERKARELRSLAERMVTRATRLGDLLLKDPKAMAPEDRARLVHAMRMVGRRLRQRSAVLHLFNEWAPRYLGRPGGYTRVFKLGNRRGDGAPMALLEFVPAEMPQREGAAVEEVRAPEKKKGLLGKLRSRKEKA